jgi:mannose-6-phosphate isomerase
MSQIDPAQLSLPLVFAPVYHSLVWGGRRMAAWRHDLPAGPIGESWDLADHDRGMSIVAEGPLKGRSLRELTRACPHELVGARFAGGDFPLLIKLIDANDRLSVQVHPDDELAVRLGVAPRGKTECWLVVADGGELFVGLKPGITREAFERALAAGTVADCLERQVVGDGDFAFLAARTVHALGQGTLIYEVQQTCDTTFRVFDWGRVGLDGKPRQLHVRESLETIDFSARGAGVSDPPFAPHPAGGTWRALAACPYFAVEERKAVQTRGGGNGACAIVVCLKGGGILGTSAGGVRLQPMRTYLVPACAGAWSATGDGELRLLVAQPA